MESTEYKKSISNQNSKIKKAWNWFLNNIYSIFHWIILIALTVYIILNWELCVSMQLFSQFDGNNILFFAWIILIFLIIYDVEAKDIKLKKHKMNEELERLDIECELKLMSQRMKEISSNIQGGDVNNESSN